MALSSHWYLHMIRFFFLRPEETQANRASNDDIIRLILCNVFLVRVHRPFPPSLHISIYRVGRVAHLESGSFSPFPSSALLSSPERGGLNGRLIFLSERDGDGDVDDDTREESERGQAEMMITPTHLTLPSHHASHQRVTYSKQSSAI